MSGDEWMDDDELDSALRALGTAPSDHAPLDPLLILAKAGAAPVVSMATPMILKWLGLGAVGGFVAGAGVVAALHRTPPAAAPITPAAPVTREVAQAPVPATLARLGPVAAGPGPASVAVDVAPAGQESRPFRGRRPTGGAPSSVARPRPGVGGAGAPQVASSEAAPTSSAAGFEAPVDRWPASPPTSPQAQPSALLRELPAPGGLPPAPSDPITASAHLARPRRPGAPEVTGRVFVGGSGGLGAWRTILPEAGPVGGAAIRVSRAAGAVRPWVDLGFDVGLLAGPDHPAPRGQIGGDLSAGLSFGNAVFAIDLGVDAALRLVPAGSREARPGEVGAGWWFVGLGPQLGIRAGRTGRPGFQVQAAVPIASLDLLGQGTVQPTPWLRVSGGLTLPIPIEAP